MAKVYANLIKKGLKTIDNVPASLKKSVQELLTAEKGNQNNEFNYHRYLYQ